MLKNSQKISFVLALMLSLVLVFSGCSAQKAEESSTPAPADTAKSDVPTCKLEVINGSSTVTLTEKELSAIESVTLKATQTKKDGTSVEYEYVGLPLAKVLEAAGVSEFKSVTATADDAYASEYTPEMVKAEGSIVAYMRDGEVLGDSGPLMTMLRDETSSTWCKKLVKLSVTQ